MNRGMLGCVSVVGIMLGQRPWRVRMPVRSGYERRYGGEEIHRDRRQVPLL